MNNKLAALVAGFCSLLISSCGPKDGEYVFTVLSTNDVHGRYFDSLYVSDRTDNSLLSVSYHVDSLRRVNGEDNVILIDAGDCLQGDNASYYFNFVDTVSTHIFARMVDYIGYDAVVVGNHDIETGHAVYDRVVEQMDTPFLAANAIRNDGAGSYFQDYVAFKRHGLKFVIIGFTNPNIKNWLSPDLWEGMHFESLLGFAQSEVDRVREAENPDIVIVATHSGTGEAENPHLEGQALALYKSLKGVDFVLGAHDHRPVTQHNDSIAYLNAGSHCRNLGCGVVKVTVEDGKIVDKSFDSSLIPVDKKKVDEQMKATFREEYEAVKAFTIREVGFLDMPLKSRDAYVGMCDYINLIHTVSLGCAPAQISFAAPLSFNGYVNPGKVIYNDLFKIYPYENQLYVVSMTGAEIKAYLEKSYETWVNTISSSSDHALRIYEGADPRTGSQRWSFEGRFYNFDSAAGINYTVDLTKPSGERVFISSLADGEEFKMDAEYNVAMTSYRASGGGGLMRGGAGINTDNIQDRVVAYYPEIRELLYGFFKKNPKVDAALIGNEKVIGSWKFVPEKMSEEALRRDMKLLFPKYYK